jgi:hypothetical protein
MTSSASERVAEIHGLAPYVVEGVVPDLQLGHPAGLPFPDDQPVLHVGEHVVLEDQRADRPAGALDHRGMVVRVDCRPSAGVALKGNVGDRCRRAAPSLEAIGVRIGILRTGVSDIVDVVRAEVVIAAEKPKPVGVGSGGCDARRIDSAQYRGLLLRPPNLVVRDQIVASVDLRSRHLRLPYPIVDDRYV